MFKIDKAAARDEWERLNPTLPAQPNTIWGLIQAAIRETMIGYWAPLRMAWWLTKTGRQ